MNGAQTSNSILEIGKGNNDMKRIAFGTALALALLVPVVSGQGVAQQQKAAQGEKKQAKQVKDPVCGMMVDPTTAEKAVHNGKTYYFLHQIREGELREVSREIRQAGAEEVRRLEVPDGLLAPGGQGERQR